MHLSLFESKLNSLPLLFRGKVRDVYDLKEALLIVATDRISAFDHTLPTPIPKKGILLTQISNFWFKQTESFAPNHKLNKSLQDFISNPEEIAQLEGRASIVKKAKPLPVELIVRGYLAGSGFKEYTQTGKVCGIPLPSRMKNAEKLKTPLFTPSTKAPQGQHDENIPFEKMVELVGEKIAEEAKSLALKIYTTAADYALTRDIIIADTKIEMGIYEGKLIVIDELLTPDSSRFWPADQYQPEANPPSFDKQFVRDYLISINWDKKSNPPPLPEEIVQKTAQKYQEAVERLTK